MIHVGAEPADIARALSICGFLFGSPVAAPSRVTSTRPSSNSIIKFAPPTARFRQGYTLSLWIKRFAASIASSRNGESMKKAPIPTETMMWRRETFSSSSNG